jgi:hypothetical protein
MSIEARPDEYGTVIVSNDPETGRVKEVSVVDGVNKIKLPVSSISIDIGIQEPNRLKLSVLRFKTNGVKGI